MFDFAIFFIHEIVDDDMLLLACRVAVLSILAAGFVRLQHTLSMLLIFNISFFFSSVLV